MNNLDTLRGSGLIRSLSARLSSLELAERTTIMEVCGTHTMAIRRAGLPSILPENLRLLSGPGCPVCVTPVSYIDTALAIARKHGAILATFGDMMRVPGSRETLAGLRSEGFPVEIVYSPLGAVELARNNPERSVVFLAVGFETTAPAVAASVIQAAETGIGNFGILTAHKRILPALQTLVSGEGPDIDGFLLPGHVSVVLGAEPYRIIPDKYRRACVITGFETADVIQGILMLVEQIRSKVYSVDNQYTRAVKPRGNPQARAFIDRVFTPADTEWRGFGTIAESGLAIREEFAGFDAARLFPVESVESREPPGCRCGDVLKGLIEPPECPLFAESCTPLNPVGACMVSSEGTCAAFYKYSRMKGR